MKCIIFLDRNLTFSSVIPMSIYVLSTEAVFRCMAVYGCVAHIKIGFVFRDPCGSVCMLKSDSYFGRLVGGVCAYNIHTP